MTDPDAEFAETPKTGIDRRHFIAYGLGGAVAVAALGFAGVDLVSRGVLPGQQLLFRIEGRCTVPVVDLRYVSPLGPTVRGTFYSHARNRMVGYWIGYPPGHGPGDELPLIVMLHGYGGNHTNALVGMSPSQAMALRVGSNPLPPMAIVTVDGGGGYWNPHPGDNPMAMVVDELIPLCQRLGLGRAPRQIGTMGISMGGYGAILFAEKYPELFSAVASISPAIWTSYGQAEGANSRAYASAADFAANDAVTHTAALKGMPVRVASGNSDPFHPGVEALAAALPPSAVVDFQKGCHLGPFFIDQEPPSLAFLGRHLAGQGEGFSNRALLWSGTVVVRSRTFGDARGSRAERIGVAAPVSGRLPPQRRRGPR